MKAAVYRCFSGPITIDDIPRPTSSDDPFGVIIQVMATGVCRSDHHGWKGHDSDIISYVKQHGFPFVPGHEVSGIIVEVGTRVVKFKVGDRVAVPFILSCGECCMCTHRNRPTICEQQEQPVSKLRWRRCIVFILCGCHVHCIAHDVLIIHIRVLQ